MVSTVASLPDKHFLVPIFKVLRFFSANFYNFCQFFTIIPKIKDAGGFLKFMETDILFVYS